MTVDIATLAIRIDSLEAREAARNLDRVGSASQRASQQGEALTGVMGKLAGVFATIKLVEGANALLESQRAFDKLNASLITATGSVQGATKAFGALQDFAASTPYGLQEVTKAFIQLRNLGLTPSERALNSYGNTASAMSKSLNQMVEAVADAATGEFERLKEFGIKAKQNGDQVSLTFQGVTTNIANNAATIEKYLIELGETKFGGGMALQAKTLDGAISNLGDTWDALKRTISQAGFGEAAHAAVLRLSDALAEMTKQVKEGGPMIEGLKAGAKVAAAYFAIFVAAPVAITAASTALTILYGIVGTGTARLLGAATATQALNTALYGTSVAAQLAAGTLTKLQLAASLVFAAFAGWEIGKYIDAQFVQARVAGEVFAGAILEGWENIRYGAVISWEAVKFAFNASIDAMKGTFADFLSSTAQGLKMVGATETGEAIAKYAEGLRAAAGAQTDFARGTALITAGHNATIKNIQDETTARVNQALIGDRVSEAEKKETGDRLSGYRVKQAAAAQSAEAAKKAAAEYAASIKAANEFITALKNEASEVGLTADQVKMMAAARAAAKAPTAELRMEIMKAALALDIETKAFAASETARKSVADATQVLTDNRAAEYAAIAAEVKANNDAIATYGLSKSAIEALTLARMQDRLARRGPQDLDLDEAEVKHLERMIALQKEKAATTTTLGGLDTGSSVTQAKELLDILVAVDNAAKSAAQGMADSFGRVGSAIGGLTTALTGYAVQQQAIAAQLAAVKADPKSGAQKIAQAEIAASKASAQARIKSYGDMAGAAKGFFKENTAGYKVLQTTEKAFRAYEMAMAIESMVTRLFATNTVTTAVVAGKAFESTAMIGAAAVDTATTGVSVANSATKATASTVAGAAKAFEQMGVYGFIGAAAIIAFMASMGSTASGGGGGGVDVAKERQKAAGTGSVLGDESAKSDSIGRSIENLEKYASVELSHTRDMLSALIKIRDTIGVVAAMASQTAGLRATALDEKKYGVGSSSGVLGIGASSTTIQDSGIKLNGSQTIGNAIASGVDATGYADILKKKSGFFGIGSSSKTSRDVIQLDDDLKKQFGLLVGSMRDGAVEAVKVLGVSADGIVEKINGMALGIDEISFKGLTGEEIEEQLQAVFSKVGDDIAKLAAPELTQFQQVGEGYLETLTRIATNYATLDSIMESSGTSFGAVGLASIAARENLIKLTGGLDALISSTESFNDNFLSEAERLAPVQKYVTDQLAAMGLQSLDTRDKFKDYVLGLANSGKLATDAGAQQYASLLALADAFAKTHAATVDLTKSEQGIADERKDLQDKLDELTMTQAQLAAKARSAIDGHNLALYDQVIAAQAAKDAAELAAEAITKAQESAAATMASFGGALLDSMNKAKEAAKAFRALNESLLIGDSSTLNPEQKYLEAKRQFETADGSNLQAAEKAFLDASKSWFGGSAGYAADFAAVIAKNNSMASQNDDLAASIPAFWELIKKQMSGVDGSHKNGLDFVPFDGYRAELHRGERVQTAAAVRDGDAAAEQTNELLRELIDKLDASLGADKTQRGAVGVAVLEKLDAVANKLDDNKRVIARNAASSPARKGVAA